MTEFGVPETPAPETTEPMSSSGTTPSGSGPRQSTAETAKEQARDVTHEGVQAGRHVASVAGDQAKEVASEAGNQAQSLLAEARSELLNTAASQQRHAADQLHGLSQELGSMASRSEQDGLATDLVQQASRRLGTVAHWVEEREPDSLVRELKNFARNKPGTFLVIAAGIGLFAGRMTRGAEAGVPAIPAQESGSRLPTASSAERGITAPAVPAGETSPAPGTRREHPDPDVGLYSGDGELTESFPNRATGTAP